MSGHLADARTKMKGNVVLEMVARSGIWSLKESEEQSERRVALPEKHKATGGAA